MSYQYKAIVLFTFITVFTIACINSCMLKVTNKH